MKVIRWTAWLLLLLALGKAPAYALLVPANNTQVDALALGNAAYEQQDWKKARHYYRQLIKKNPKNAAAINNLGMVDLREGKDPGKAVQRLEEAVIFAGPMRPYLLDTLVLFAFRECRYSDAEVLLKRIAEEKDLPPAFVQAHRLTRQKVATILPPQPTL